MLTSSMDEAAIIFIMITVFVFQVSKKNRTIETAEATQRSLFYSKRRPSDKIREYNKYNNATFCVYHGVRLALSIRTLTRDPVTLVGSAELSPPFLMRTLNGRSRRTVASVLKVFPELPLERSSINITFLLITLFKRRQAIPTRTFS